MDKQTTYRKRDLKDEGTGKIMKQEKKAKQAGYGNKPDRSGAPARKERGAGPNVSVYQRSGGEM